ncbi:MAG: type II secretion system protein [Desulfobacterium sp.]|nr:type II secretion system protein [Desulfobacterium sp.]
MYIVIGTRFRARGFSLFELMLVISIIGLMLAVIIPQGQRAQFEAKAGIVRQNASEAGSYVVAWAQKQAQSLPQKYPLTIESFIMGNAQDADVDASKYGPINHYTGNQAFDGVKSLVHPDAPIRNPFNQVSIFDRLNDDTKIPGRQPGLLFLIAEPMGKEAANHSSNNLYFIYTGTDGRWYGSIDAATEAGIRRGIFVARFSNLEATVPLQQQTQGETPDL